jgi:hypothetical protein
VESSHDRDQTVERLLRQSFETPPRGLAGGACLDAETLSAWTAGSLSGSALEAVQLHVADCSRCQELAGTLMRLSATVPHPEPSAPRRRWLAWFVPLAAAAAAVVIWFAVPGNLGKPVTTGELERARASRGAAAPEVTSPERPSLEAAPAAVPEQAENKVVAGTDADRQRAAAPARAPAQPQEEQRDALVQREARPAQNAPQAAPPPSAAETAAASVQADKDVAPAAPAARKVERFNVAGAAALAVPDIVSPDPAVRWRIAGSTVQHSSDGGATWEAVSIGFPAELTAGVAPAANVCWLVGRNGVVLLTIDGRTWRRIPFPETADLAAVRTVDAGGRVATVFAADGRTFVTTDAGSTWASRP